MSDDLKKRGFKKSNQSFGTISQSNESAQTVSGIVSRASEVLKSEVTHSKYSQKNKNNFV
jgi:hypothetical protein